MKEVEFKKNGFFWVGFFCQKKQAFFLFFFLFFLVTSLVFFCFFMDFFIWLVFFKNQKPLCVYMATSKGEELLQNQTTFFWFLFFLYARQSRRLSGAYIGFDFPSVRLSQMVSDALLNTF